MTPGNRDADLYRRRRPGGDDGGPAVRARGCEVLVLEKHADFFRDFRGDTVHPSTLELLRELGLLDDSSSARTTRCGR